MHGEKPEISSKALQQFP